MIASTLTRSTLVLFVVSAIETMQNAAEQAKNPHKTIIVSGTDTPIVTDATKDVVVTDAPVSQLSEVFEADPSAKFSKRAWLEMMADYSLVKPSRQPIIKKAVGKDSATKVTAEQFAKWLTTALIDDGCNTTITQFDGSIMSLIQVINDQSLTEAFEGATYHHQVVVDNDAIQVNKKGAGKVNFVKSTVTADVVTYLTFPHSNKAGVPIQITRNINLAKTGWHWFALVRGTTQYDAAINGYNEGSLKLVSFGLTRMTTGRIESAYYGLLLHRSRLEAAGMSTFHVDRLMASFIQAKGNMDRYLAGIYVAEQDSYETLFDGNNTGNIVG